MKNKPPQVVEPLTFDTLRNMDYPNRCKCCWEGKQEKYRRAYYDHILWRVEKAYNLKEELDK